MRHRVVDVQTVKQPRQAKWCGKVFEEVRCALMRVE